MKVPLILVLVVVAFAFATPLKHTQPQKLGAAPPNPQWPAAYSASVFIQRDDGTNDFFRWFYDSTLDMDRFDSMGFYENEGWFQIRIYNHQTETGYTVFEQPGTEVCFFGPINGTVPHPVFSSFQYIGQGNINFNSAYLWFYVDKTQNVTYTYWEAQSTSEPLRLDIADNNNQFSETWLFWEFDEATDEDQNLYYLPEEIVATCNRGQ